MGEKSNYKNVLNYLSLDLRKVLERLRPEIQNKVEEIRLRTNIPLILRLKGKNYFLKEDGSLSNSSKEGFIVNRNNLENTFNLICNYSPYAFEEEMRNGFITIRGGNRVGIGGKLLYNSYGIEKIKYISSLNIRIAKQIFGVSNKIFPYIFDPENEVYNILIISPPNCGKTTLLRDLIRQISKGISGFMEEGMTVGVIDERSELAAMYNGVPQYDLGPRTDVLDGSNKVDGTTMLIRAMSPDVIAMDEIGSFKDVDAIHEAMKSGVKIIATVHGSSIEDINSKESLQVLISDKTFDIYIILDNSKGIGTIKDIISVKSGTSIYKGK